jgi:ring-1,2-phenylacetyl-CoA epoxidase subunit PaaD
MRQRRIGQHLGDDMGGDMGGNIDSDKGGYNNGPIAAHALDAFDLADPRPKRRAHTRPNPAVGAARVQAAHDALEAVMDPEIPVINLRELGVLRDVALADNALLVTITPTYAGCPAMSQMREDIEVALHNAGLAPFEVRTVLSPAWTTDWMSARTHDKLRAYGIAPPAHLSTTQTTHTIHWHKPRAATPACPQCNSTHTEVIAQSGSTACKALYRCTQCLEPFDYFKPY